MASADQLSVDLDGLESFSAALQSIRSSMSGAHAWMREFDGELGGHEVDRALDNFESEWSDGRGRVDKNCEQFINLVKTAVDNIRQADDGLRDQLIKSAEQA
jgi:hypothetical protein